MSATLIPGARVTEAGFAQALEGWWETAAGVALFTTLFCSLEHIQLMTTTSIVALFTTLFCSLHAFS